MPMLWSPDKRILFAIETAGEGDGNSVVYYDGVPVWDRFSWEATHAPPPSPLPPQPPRPNPPPPSVPPPPEPPPTEGVFLRRGEVIRVTTDADGPFAPRMMSYWANAWVSGPFAYVFAGSVLSGGPQFFAVDLESGAVSRLGPMVPYGGETEGWEWLPDGRVQLFHGPQLRRVNPFTGADQLVFDVSERFPGHTLWQPHASPSGRTISATLKDPDWQKVATVVWQDGTLHHYPKEGTLDESSLCGDEWVVIKQGDGGEDNCVITIATGEERWIDDHDRAIGHSDCWPPYLVGEADKPDPGGCGVWDLRDLSFRFLFPTLNMGYISAKAGRYLHSDDTHISLLDIQTGERTPILEHGAGVSPGMPNYYDDRVKANLSPCGRIACYMLRGSVYIVGVA